jgi:LysM repeat protein
MSTLTLPRPYTPTYRLTRRGRLVVVALALLVILAVGIFLAAGAVGTSESGSPEPTETVMVGTGDTLWGIAAEAADGGDVREMVERIKRLNALDTGMVTAGQRLRVPSE